MADAQLKLFTLPNALHQRFGSAFFRALPAGAGVYLMFDGAGRILYVGKARNLRQRVGSYRYVEEHSRKAARLVARVATIRWQVCQSEEAALLEENRLLRALRPRFNRANTWPKAARFVCLAEGTDVAGEGAIELGLSAEPRGECYGAFKGASRQNFHALLRLLSALDGSYAGLPRLLLLEQSRKYSFAREAAEKWLTPLRALLRGECDGLLRCFSAAAVHEDGPFHTSFRQADLLAVEQFFSIGPRRNRELREQFGAAEVIAQEELDDLLVRHRQSRIGGAHSAPG